MVDKNNNMDNDSGNTKDVPMKDINISKKENLKLEDSKPVEEIKNIQYIDPITKDYITRHNEVTCNKGKCLEPSVYLEEPNFSKKIEILNKE